MGGTAVRALMALLVVAWLAPAARAGVPAGMPADVPAAASLPLGTLPEPSSASWPFPSTFPGTSGTGRLAGGAQLWSDFIYDDYGASSPQGYNTSTFSQSTTLAGRQGDYVFPSGPSSNNGADIFRAAIGDHGGFSYWRVDWVTLTDPSVPIAEWTFDTDDNAATGTAQWPAGAGVSSPGIDRALVVSSRGAWLVNALTGARTDVTAHGGRLTVDRAAKAFIVAIPHSLLPVGGNWRVRLGAGLADSSGQSFAAPFVNSASGQSSSAERVYNITFRSVAQEPPVYTDGMSDALIAAAQAAAAANPVGATLGADGLARSVTGNFWMEDDQADTLASGDVSKFSLLVNWSQLSTGASTPEPQPTGYSTRWYVSRLDPPGDGQRIDDGTEGDFKPTLLERLQPYAVYVPTRYRQGKPTELTWILHSLEVNYNQYGGLDPQMIQQLCQDRGSICATTEGFGPSGWYFNEAETDYWQVWHSLAQAYTLDPERTAVTGYSMGGWAAYKLGFEHPDDYAGALSLDGPVVCGIEVFPGVDGGSQNDPTCAQDGQSQPLVGNARWIPYVIDQTYADELVPTTGVIAQAQTFDQLGQRYQFFIHTGADHLIFATEDRFSDAVAALGQPVRTKNPGAFTYTWYPGLDDSALGIGATGDYWLSALSARNKAHGTLASIQAVDAALPDPAVTVQRSGPGFTSEPLPGSVQALTWKLGARPASRAAMTLKLTDVGGLTVDAASARLRSGTVTVATDGATRLAFAGLRGGTEVVKAGQVLSRAGGDGRAIVTLASGTTTLTLLPAPAHRFACRRPTGRLTARAVGPVGLGMTRARTQSFFARRATHGRPHMDFFCEALRGVRVGYASHALLAPFGARLRRALLGRVVLVLTSNRHFSLHGLRPGSRFSLRGLHGYRVGANTWYRVGRTGVLKVRHGVIQEVGIADPRLTATRREALRFFMAFG